MSLLSFISGYETNEGFVNNSFFAENINNLIEEQEKSRLERNNPSFLKKLLSFFSNKDDLFVTFEAAGIDGWAQATVEGQDILLNFSYPFKEPFETVFKRFGINIPSHWRVDYYSEGKALTFVASRTDISIAASFLSDLFLKMYKCPPDLKLSATF